MRFLIDMPLSPDLCQWLEMRGHDAIHAGETGLGQAPDTIILEHARRDGRVVITADLDYPRLLALTHAQSPGLILFRGGNFSEQECIERLSVVLGKVTAKAIEHSVVVVERSRIRVRRLPEETSS